MSAFLKIDRCASCGKELPWDWIPPVAVGARILPGTGVWRSTLVDDACPPCRAERDRLNLRADRLRTLRERFIRVVGGSKPYRAFTFERYCTTPANRAAFVQAKAFDPSKLNLYLWGSCGVGKTHLAVAVLRQWFGRGAPGAMTTPFQLVRRLRMKTPENEQHAIDELVNATVLVLDDLGAGGESPYARQALQEILDARDFLDRGGLVVTSPYAPVELGRRWAGPAIASRLAGMCRVIEIRGVDHRQGGERARDA